MVATDPGLDLSFTPYMPVFPPIPPKPLKFRFPGTCVKEDLAVPDSSIAELLREDSSSSVLYEMGMVIKYY